MYNHESQTFYTWTPFDNTHIVNDFVCILLLQRKMISTYTALCINKIMTLK